MMYALMSDLRHREGDAGAIDPEGDDFVAQFDREFGAPRRRRPSSTTPPAARPTSTIDGDGDGDADPAGTRAGRRAEAGVARCRPRVGMRIIRRPYEWFRRPWPDDRVVRLAVTVSTLVVTTFIMMRVVHFRPILGDDLIFDDVTPTGGDMGSHVWAPAYLRDHLLPNFQLSGWSMDWYGGLPVYRFYMVVPALAMVAPRHGAARTAWRSSSSPSPGSSRCRSRAGRSAGSPASATRCPSCSPSPGCASPSTRARRSTAATCWRRWPASSPSRSPSA